MPADETLLTTPRFRVVRRIITTPDGRQHAREIIEHPGAVTILPLLQGDRVCLLRNYRVAVDETLIELPAGTLEPDEDPAKTAERELIEETGYRPGKLEKLHEFYMSPGILHERMHLFLATDLTPGPAAPEAGEQLEPFVATWSDAMDLVRTGQIRDAKTLVGLLLYDRIRRGT